MLSNINGKKQAPIPASVVDGDIDEDSDNSNDDAPYFFMLCTAFELCVLITGSCYHCMV
jgi:hypothetical protein